MRRRTSSRKSECRPSGMKNEKIRTLSVSNRLAASSAARKRTLRVEVPIDRSLADWRTDRRHRDSGCIQQPTRALELFGCEVDDVDAPGRAQLERSDALLLQHRDLILEPWSDLVTECTDGPAVSHFQTALPASGAIRAAPDETRAPAAAPGSSPRSRTGADERRPRRAREPVARLRSGSASPAKPTPHRQSPLSQCRGASALAAHAATRARPW